MICTTDLSHTKKAILKPPLRSSRRATKGSRRWSRTIWTKVRNIQKLSPPSLLMKRALSSRPRKRFLFAGFVWVKMTKRKILWLLLATVRAQCGTSIWNASASGLTQKRPWKNPRTSKPTTGRPSSVNFASQDFQIRYLRMVPTRRKYLTWVKSSLKNVEEQLTCCSTKCPTKISSCSKVSPFKTWGSFTS